MARYLVIGGAGYVGGNCLNAIIESGAEAVVYDNLSAGTTEFIPPQARLVKADIRDEAALSAALAEGFDAVLHFAAKIEVGESVKDPLLFYDNNVAGMITLLRCTRKYGINKIVFSSSAAVYGEPETIPIPESDPKRPTSPYGRTKLMMEEVLGDCAAAYGLKYCALRYFNASGAAKNGRNGELHNPETHLIPNVLMAAAGLKEALSVFGDDYPTDDGSALRDYVHVSDLADAHVRALKLLNSPEFAGGCFNVGSGEGFTVLQVLRAAEKITGRPIPYKMAPRRAGDPAKLVADPSLFKNLTGWSPKITNVAETIEDAWRFHCEYGFGPNRKRLA